ncbi:MAG: DUF1553 domain-containing protein [Thermoguttaceae bacterium]
MWLLVGSVLGLLVAVAGLVFVLAGRSAAPVIPAIADQELIQGQTLWLEIPPSPGYPAGQLRYRLSEAPPGAAIDGQPPVLSWPTDQSQPPGQYRITIAAMAAGQKQADASERTFLVHLGRSLGNPPAPAQADSTDFAFDLAGKLAQSNPFQVEAEPVPRGKIDELVFARLKELKIAPSSPCSDGVFLRRVYLDTLGTLPTVDECRRFLDDDKPDKRARLIDELLQRPEFADYLAMKWSDLLRVKAEFPINLWPNASQAYHHWIRTSIEENMPYDRFVRELLTACGSNFRTPQVNFYRALQSKEPAAIAGAVAQAFMGARTDGWPKERLAGMAVFFSQVGFKPTGEWKEEIIVWDPRKVNKDAASPPAQPVFPDGTPGKLLPGKDPREIFADWLIDPKNPWFTRHIVNRTWYWLLGRGIVHEADDIRPDNPAQNPELLNWLAAELVRAKYDLKHIYRVILNSQTYQLSAIPKGDPTAAAANFACYGLRRVEAEVILDAICQVTGTTETYSSMIPEPFTFIPAKQRSVTLPDGSINSSVLELFGRPPRDTGLESERNNRFTAPQALHLINSTHILKKIREGPGIQELLESASSSGKAETLYLAILSRRPTAEEQSQASGQAESRSGAEDLAWALINSDEFLFKH